MMLLHILLKEESKYIYNINSYLKKGFVYLGTMMASGINKGTEYLN